MKCFVYIELADDENGRGPPLADAWFYWKEGGTRSLLRTDAAGLLLELKPSGQSLNPFDYDQVFQATLDTSVSVCYSCFAQPLPDGFLDDHPEVFVERKVKLHDDDGESHDAFPTPDVPDRPDELTDEIIAAALGSEQAAESDRTVLSEDQPLFAAGDALGGGNEPRVRPSNLLGQQRPRQRRRRRRRAPVAPHTPEPPTQPAQPAPAPVTTNTLVPAPWVRVALPDVKLEVTYPQEFGIWPALRDPPPDTYLTDGLTEQGAALWGTRLTVTENEVIATPRAAQPPERGLAVRGSVDARATALKIEVRTAWRGANPTAIDLLPDPAQTTTATEVDATLSAAAGTMKPFEAHIFLADAPPAFGLVEITFRALGTPVPLVEAMTCQLSGVQIALVNDYDADPDGKQPGPVRTEADEVRIVDFRSSPKPDRDAQRAETRQRRMIRYRVAVRERTVGTPPTNVQHPEMPMWMAEVDLLGISMASLEVLLVLRHLFKFQVPTRPRVIAFDFSFQIHLEWEGPDWGEPSDPDRSPRAHRTLHDLASPALKVVLGLARDQTNHAQLALPLNVTARGKPFPVPQLDFPVPGRRKAAVAFDERPWGRAGAAGRAPGMLLEWQPSYRGEREIIRGGNGTLKIPKLAVGGVEIDPGIDRSTKARATWSETPLPTFRLSGDNPRADGDHIDVITDYLVAEYHAAHAAEAHIRFLHIDTWKTTLRLILRHESKGMHFRVQGAPIVPTPTAIIRYVPSWFGHQHDMPLFGPPHGYGIAQLDNPKPTDDRVWSFLENIRFAVELAMGDKARAAWGTLRSHLTSTQLGRAVFQREVVRRYNGKTEFRWNGTRFEIYPTNPQVPRAELRYPSDVLHTDHIHYWTGTGASATFPWPIAFGYNPADFGPGTDLAP